MKTSQIRQMRIAEDFQPVMEMVIKTFEPVLTVKGLEPQQVQNAVTKLTPILWILDRFRIIHRFWADFVYVDGGEIMGVLTVKRISLGDKQRWLLCNASAHPTLKPKGFELIGKAQKLFKTAITHAQKMGAEWIFADVRTDNPFAYKFLTHQGFIQVSENLYFRKDDNVFLKQTNADVSVRICKLQDSWRVWNFKRTTSSMNAPIFNDDKKSVASWIADCGVQTIKHRLARQEVHCLAAETKGRLVGILQLTFARKESLSHQLEMTVHPDWHGRVEPILIYEAGALLKERLSKSIVLRVQNPSSEQMFILKQLGFRVVLNYHRLGLRLATKT